MKTKYSNKAMSTEHVCCGCNCWSATYGCAAGNDYKECVKKIDPSRYQKSEPNPVRYKTKAL